MHTPHTSTQANKHIHNTHVFVLPRNLLYMCYILKRTRRATYDARKKSTLHTQIVECIVLCEQRALEYRYAYILCILHKLQKMPINHVYSLYERYECVADLDDHKCHLHRYQHTHTILFFFRVKNSFVFRKSDQIGVITHFKAIQDFFFRCRVQSKQQQLKHSHNGFSKSPSMCEFGCVQSISVTMYNQNGMVNGKKQYQTHKTRHHIAGKKTATKTT